MWYSFAADIIVAFHLAFVAFALFGGWLALKWRWVPYVHLPTAAWAAVIEFTGWICPLTPLEQKLRFMSGGEGYSGSFVEHYLEPVLYPASLTPNAQTAIGLFVVAMTVAAYGTVIIRARLARTRKPL